MTGRKTGEATRAMRQRGELGPQLRSGCLECGQKGAGSMSRRLRLAAWWRATFHRRRALGRRVRRIPMGMELDDLRLIDCDDMHEWGMSRSSFDKQHPRTTGNSDLWWGRRILQAIQDGRADAPAGLGRTQFSRLMCPQGDEAASPSARWWYDGRGRNRDPLDIKCPPALVRRPTGRLGWTRRLDGVQLANGCASSIKSRPRQAAHRPRQVAEWA